DGTLNESGFMRDVANHPDAAWKAPEAMGAMLQRKGQALQNTGIAISNRTAQIEQDAKNQAFVTGSFSMIHPENPTEEQIQNWAVMMKRNFPHTPSAVINGIAQTALTDPLGLKHGVATMRSLSQGVSGSERVEGPPSDTGAPQTTSKSAATFAGTYPTA